jgi:flagellar biosynthesis/type III secretory pathway chaperone
MEDLLADREEISSELKDLSAARTKIYNKMRRAKPEDLPELRSKRDELSKKIEILRRDLKCNHKIEERSATIKDKLLTVLENERTHSLDGRNRSRASGDRNER